MCILLYVPVAWVVVSSFAVFLLPSGAAWLTFHRPLSCHDSENNLSEVYQPLLQTTEVHYDHLCRIIN